MMPRRKIPATETQKWLGRTPWRAILMVAGSVLLGGTAVALWNRHALSEIQGHSPARSREPLDIEEIHQHEWDDAT
jgi:hypothetical protein